MKRLLMLVLFGLLFVMPTNSSLAGRDFDFDDVGDAINDWHDEEEKTKRAQIKKAERVERERIRAAEKAAENALKAQEEREERAHELEMERIRRGVSHPSEEAPAPTVVVQGTPDKVWENRIHEIRRDHFFEMKVLKDEIATIKEQVGLLKEKMVLIETENALLRARLQEEQAKNMQITAENARLRAEIERLRNEQTKD